MESACTSSQRNPISSLTRNPVYTATKTIVEYGSGISLTSCSNCSGVMCGFALRLPLLLVGSYSFHWILHQQTISHCGTQNARQNIADFVLRFLAERRESCAG